MTVTNNDRDLSRGHGTCHHACDCREQMFKNIEKDNVRLRQELETQLGRVSGLVSLEIELRNQVALEVSKRLFAADKLTAVENERDQLRAEVERLKGLIKQKDNIIDKHQSLDALDAQLTEKQAALSLAAEALLECRDKFNCRPAHDALGHPAITAATARLFALEQVVEAAKAIYPKGDWLHHDYNPRTGIVLFNALASLAQIEKGKV